MSHTKQPRIRLALRPQCEASIGPSTSHLIDLGSYQTSSGLRNGHSSGFITIFPETHLKSRFHLIHGCPIPSGSHPGKKSAPSPAHRQSEWANCCPMAKGSIKLRLIPRGSVDRQRISSPGMVNINHFRWPTRFNNYCTLKTYHCGGRRE